MIGFGFRWHAFHHEHGRLFNEDPVKVFVQVVAFDVAEAAQGKQEVVRDRLSKTQPFVSQKRRR